MMFSGETYSQGPNRVSTRLILISSFCESACSSCLLLAAAKQLALEFGGQLLDDKRSVMTKQTEQHFTSKIREFERKNLIASA